jgi:hypothetical protein
MIARFEIGRKVRCHNGAVEKWDLKKGPYHCDFVWWRARPHVMIGSFIDYVPSPPRVIRWGLPPPLSKTLMIALLIPFLDGVKVTLTESRPKCGSAIVRFRKISGIETDKADMTDRQRGVCVVCQNDCHRRACCSYLLAAKKDFTGRDPYDGSCAGRVARLSPLNTTTTEGAPSLRSLQGWESRTFIPRD